MITSPYFPCYFTEFCNTPPSLSFLTPSNICHHFSLFLRLHVLPSCIHLSSYHTFLCCSNLLYQLNLLSLYDNYSSKICLNVPFSRMMTSAARIPRKLTRSTYLQISIHLLRHTVTKTKPIQKTRLRIMYTA